MSSSAFSSSKSPYFQLSIEAKDYFYDLFQVFYQPLKIMNLHMKDPVQKKRCYLEKLENK